MKKFLAITSVLALAFVLIFSFAACGPTQNVKLTDIDYSTVLLDYLEYPNSENDAKMSEITRNVKQIYEDSSLTDAQKIAEMMERSTNNEIACAYFAYFRDQIGETKIGSNSGQLVYQRLRRQSDTIKDDTTIKLPVNDNFDVLARTFVTSADIRYINNNKYNRMDNKSKIVYNEKTGLLEVEQWQKQSRENWNKDEKATDSRSYAEARKTCINWKKANIVDSTKKTSIEIKQDSKGNNYYQLTYSIDVAVANADKETIGRLENDNGGKDMSYNYCNLVVEIWENGLAKCYKIDESWNGKIGGVYKGSAQSKSTVIYSYSERDLDYSKTDTIFKGIKK